ncbi:hypothetical protein C8F04DRAFT_1295406, partial [Mycena alexandri]
MTSKLHALMTDVRLGLLIPAVALSVLLLAGFAYLRWRPVSAPHLNRVSFRLLVYAMIANVIVGIIALIPMTDHSPGCSFFAFLDGGVGGIFVWLWTRGSLPRRLSWTKTDAALHMRPPLKMAASRRQQNYYSNEAPTSAALLASTSSTSAAPAAFNSAPCAAIHAPCSASVSHNANTRTLSPCGPKTVTQCINAAPSSFASREPTS